MGVQAFNLTQSNENYIINHAQKGKRSQLVNRMVEYYRYTDVSKFSEYQDLLARNTRANIAIVELEAELAALKGQNDPQKGGYLHRFFGKIRDLVPRP